MRGKAFAACARRRVSSRVVVDAPKTPQSPTTMRRVALLSAVLAVAVAVCAASAAVGVGAASAAAPTSGAPVIADCRLHGRLTQTYSIAQLENALATMPIDVQQYTDCEDVIRTALNDALRKAGTSGSTTGGGSGGSFLPTWLIVVIIVLVLGALGFAVAAYRQRRQN
jgi:hypothetical protein